ncbi:MAG TPA: hypothetical protein VK179_13810 [Bacteroidales bacterium]|nr:hypothetical protein [Bacteroidales bacterium]
MKIGLLTVAHKRPEVSKAYCLMVDRLMKDYPDIFLPVCAVSLQEDFDIFNSHGIETYIFPNDPVGAKHNFILGKLRDRVTHVLHLGSDDLINNNYVDELIKNAKNDLVWGVGLYFLSLRTGQARFWDMPYRNVAGPAKLISKRVLKAVDWKIWNDRLNKGLDHSCFSILEPHIKSRHIFQITDVNGLMVDIKGSYNINPFETFLRVGKEVDREHIYNKLPAAEVEYLKSICN